LFVGPIVDDMAEQVSICATGQILEKVSLYDGAPVVNSLSLQVFTRSLDDMA
jgi:hypothetical protein